MEILAADDSSSLNQGETNFMMETLDDTISDFLKMKENNFLEQSTISIPLEDENTDSNTEQIPDSSEPPVKKRKRKNLKEVLKKRARKYLGMKGYELRTILMADSLKFCQEYNLVAKAAMCFCGVNMHLTPSKQCSDRVVWNCRKGGHSNAVTVRKNSFFEKSRISLAENLWIIYMWIHEYSYLSMLHETDVSNQCLDEWCKNCREVCHPILSTKTDPIGGTDKIIEVFEAKFKDTEDSKKKRRKGSSGQWIFCAVEQFSTNCVYLSVPDKKRQTLCDIFDNYLLPGTKVYSHLWNIYAGLDEESFDYLTKEKMLLFYDCNSKADIRSFKRFQNVSGQSEPSLNYWDKNEFCEFMYRKTLYFAPDAFLTFIKDIAKVCSPEGGIIKKDTPKPTPKVEKKVSTSQQEVTNSENNNEHQKEVTNSENGNEHQKEVTISGNCNENEEIGTQLNENL